MQLISFFSGIGGFEIAARQMGWDNVFSCEINPFGQKVLKYHFPEAYHHDDIKTFNIETLKKSRWNPSADSIVCGGFPCQPYSAAGKRLGKEDDRHLWPEMLRAIWEIQPTWVVGENVRGLTNWNWGMVFDEVQADLEAAGYEVTPFLLPACGVGAPHRRDRVWFVAYRESELRNRDNGQSRGFRESFQTQVASMSRIPESNDRGEEGNAPPFYCTEGESNGNGSYKQNQDGQSERKFKNGNAFGKLSEPRNPKGRNCVDGEGSLEDRNNSEREAKTLGSISDQRGSVGGLQSGEIICNGPTENTNGIRWTSNEWQQREFSTGNNERLSADDGEIGVTTNPRSQQLQERTQDIITEDRKEDRAGMDNRAERQGNFGDAANTSNKGLQRGKEYRSIGVIGQNRNKQLTGCVPSAWQNFPTQPPICSGNDELSSRLVGITFSKHRNESIKALGNAVVPALVLQIFKAIEAMTKI